MNEASVTLHQLLMLNLLAQRGACTLSEVAHELNMSQSASSQMIDRLVQLGLVARGEDPRDRRQKRLEATPEAARLTGSFSGAARRTGSQGVAALSPTLRHELADVLRRAPTELAGERPRLERKAELRIARSSGQAHPGGSRRVEYLAPIRPQGLHAKVLYRKA